jgi:hypothetical protein
VELALSGAAAYRPQVEPLEPDELLGPQPALPQHAQHGRVAPAQQRLACREALGLADQAVVLGGGKRLDRAPGVLALRPRRLHRQREPSLPLIELVVLDEEAQERVESRALLGHGERRARLPQLALIRGEFLERQVLGATSGPCRRRSQLTKRAQAER